jgi:hypothetical protein
MVSSYPCPQILDFGGKERQAYYDTATILAVKCFIVMAPVLVLGYFNKY